MPVKERTTDEPSRQAVEPEYQGLDRAQAKGTPRPQALVSVVALLCFSVIEYACFGCDAKRINLFTDEWELFGRLHFLSHQIPSYVAEILRHPLLVIRPLQAPLLGTLYFSFGDAAAGYHIANLFVEVAGAQFLYLALSRLTGLSSLSFLCAALFLIYPNHPDTHFSVTALVQNLGTTFFLASLWQLAKAVQQKARGPLLCSYTLFCLSLFTYEHCLPLIALTLVCVAWLLLREGNNWGKAWTKAALYQIPFMVSGAVLILYRMLYLPAVGFTQVYRKTFDWNHFVAVYERGLDFSIGPGLVRFCQSMANQMLAGGLPVSRLLGLIEIAAAITAGVFLIRYMRKGCEDSIPVGTASSKSTYTFLVAFALISLLLPYVTYCFAADYLPALDNLQSRVNAASSLGAAVLTATFLTILCKAPFRKQSVLAEVMLGLLCVSLSTFFVLSDWGSGQPWIISSDMQKAIMKIVKTNAPRLHSADSIILINTPRYVMWAPLFDSTWDFQSMVRIVLDDKKARAGVVSERMKVAKDSVKDVSWGQICGQYPFKRMVLLKPSPEMLIEVDSPDQFIDAVEKQGMKFGLDPKTPRRWRLELAHENQGPI